MSVMMYIPIFFGIYIMLFVVLFIFSLSKFTFKILQKISTPVLVIVFIIIFLLINSQAFELFGLGTGFSFIWLMLDLLIIVTFIKILKKRSSVQQPTEKSEDHKNDMARPEPEPIKKEQINICEYCGNELSETDKKCPCCGARRKIIK